MVAGIGEAIEEKKNRAGANTVIAVFKTELFCIVSVSQVIVSPRLRHLDMPALPKMIRTHVTTKLQVRKHHIMDHGPLHGMKW